MHAGEHDDVGIGVHRLTRQGQAVADDVGHRVEDLGCLVVVGQNDRVVFALERKDGLDVTGVEGPLHGRDVMPHAGVEIGQGQGRRHQRSSTDMAASYAQREH